ncbi:MAG: choice-of-anchor L domain-containing protein [Nannocystaceae bacterium]|nr:choice-of-anchor L domain-containing protein [bacterium]
MMVRGFLCALLVLGGAACDSGDAADEGSPDATSLTTAGVTAGADASSGGPGSTTGDASGGTTSGPGTSTGDDEPVEPPVIFDFGQFPDVDGSFCGAPNPVNCDDEDDDPWHAIGLNCAAGPQVEGSFSGDPDQIYVHEGNFGTSDEFPPREGEKFVILSSGIASEMVTTVGGTIGTSMGGGNLPDLPDPMTRVPVSGTETCADNPALVGTGDCSNTIDVQYAQGGTANDLAYMRLSAEVPANTFGFTYDFAFFSVEYPVYYQTQYNDMYVAWLESEAWTGNISFDEFGSPISLNAGFLDFKDVPGGAFNDPECAAGCSAPELAGTAAQGHAGTRWLTTNAPVVPGEQIEVYFAIFDLADTALDSAVIVDNWLWTCDGGPPVTIPG